LTRKDLKNYFFNKIYSKIEPESLYQKVLFNEIKLCLEQDYYTNFQVEIDQSSSVAILFSIFFKNKRLAELSNITNVDTEGLYSFLMKNSHELLKDCNVEDSKHKSFILNYLKTNRKFIKYIFMC